MTQVKEKNLSVEIDAKMTMIIEQADKDIKIIHNCNCISYAQKARENIENAN